MTDASPQREPVLYEVADRIATITLSRPHRRNAWTGRMHAAYRQALEQAELDSAVRAIVVTGAENSFCVGADSAALDGHVDKGGYDSGLRSEPAMPGAGVDERFEADFAYHFALTKPVVAAINGAAAGVGLVLACYADIRFAVPGAKLTTAHGRLNLPAEYGLSWLLPRLIGAARATELLFTSRVFTTDEAHDIGLIHELHEPDALLPETHRWTKALLSDVSAGSLAASKRQLYTDLHGDIRSAVEDAQRRLDQMTTEPDYARGVRALLDREPPKF